MGARQSLPSSVDDAIAASKCRVYKTNDAGKAEYFRTDINANTKSKCKREARLDQKYYDDGAKYTAKWG